MEDFYALREAWNLINDYSPKGNVFLSWEWLYSWWETYAKDGKRQLYILSCTNIHNEILGIAPFQIVNNPKKYFPCNRQIQNLGTGETDGCFVFGEYMDLIIKPGHETDVISSFSDFLSKQKFSWDGLKFHGLLKDSYLSRLFEDQHYAGINKLVKSEKQNGFRTIIELPETYKEYLMSVQKKMRNNITRTFSRLQAEQQFTIETINDVSAVEDAITTLAELNRSRRNSMAKESSFRSRKFEEFHKRLAKRLIPQNKVSLRLMKVDNKPVAALYCFIDSDTIHPYQSGFDTDFGQRYSLLTTMLTQEISNSIDNPELKRFNFMYADHEDTYKKRYSGNIENMYQLSFDKPGIQFSIYRFIHGPVKELVKKILRRG